MTRTKSTKQSRPALRAEDIIERIGDRELTRSEIADMVHCSPEICHTSMMILRGQRRLYISRYVVQEGAPRPYYRAGNQDDAEQPTHDTNVAAAATRILAALKETDLTAQKIKELDGLRPLHIVHALRQLRADRKIYICSISWKLRTYRHGTGKDVVPPRKPIKVTAPLVRRAAPPPDPLMAALFLR